MVNDGPLSGQWMNIVYNINLDIVEITNANDNFFFGLHAAGLIGKNMAGLARAVPDNGNRDQMLLIVNGLKKSWQKKRNVYLNYISFPFRKDKLHIVAHIQYENDNRISMYVTRVEAEDIEEVYTAKPVAITEHEAYSELKKKYDDLYNQNYTIIESLPVGVELYSTNGDMLYLNDKDCEIFGADKEEVLTLKVNIFSNPNLPDEVKDAVRRNEKIHTYFPYSFSVVADTACYTSTHANGIRQIECNGTPVINNSGEVVNYVFIVNDITEFVLAGDKLNHSKRKMELAIQVSGIMLWEFDIRTRRFTFDRNSVNDDSKLHFSINECMQLVDPDDTEQISGVIDTMLKGIDETFSIEVRAKFGYEKEWEYCTISGSPFYIGDDRNVYKYVGFCKTNTELRKKQFLLENILNSIPLPILIKDLESNYSYVFCNQEGKKMFGCNEFQSAHDILDDRQTQRIQQTDEEVYKTGIPFFGQEKIVLRDGRVYETIVRKSVIYDDGKRLVLSVRWDQSLQNELMRRSKILSISMNTLNAYTWHFDFDSAQMTFGDGFERTGGDADSMNSFGKVAAHIHPEDRFRFMELVNNLEKKESGDFAVEYRIDLSGEGVYEWWECRGSIETMMLSEQPYKYMFGMNINIEKHKQIEMTLRKNKAELRNLIRQNELVLNNTNSGLAYISRDYVVEWENISICSASISHEAYKKGELCYKSSYNRDTPCENCVLMRAMESRQMEKAEFSLEDAKIVEIFATPVFGINGEADGIVIRIDDITERRRMIADLQEAKLLAEQSDKLKSAFLANMSHEIRTPLNAIVGFSELLSSAETDEDKNEYMDIIHNNNELLLKLISDILDLSKIEAGSIGLKYEEFDLATYFDDITAAMMQRVSNPDVRLISVNPYKRCLIEFDKSRLAQILINYVTNAIKYTPEGLIEMGYECVDGGVRLYVKDTGIGIADNKKCKVFQRFSKLDEFAQGTGLGLSICKAISEACGGSVGFDSEYGHGSLFWAVIPCHTHIEPRIQESMPTDIESLNRIGSGQKQSDDSCRMTILVAEDIQSNYLLLEKLLQRRYNLIHALDGREAVEIVKSEHVDLVLMDMKMPVKNGLDATAEIRAFDTSIPIVALTAHAFDSDKVAALDAGCNEYLVKPLDKVKLMNVLEKYT